MDLIQLSSSILNTLLYATSYVMSKYIYRIQKHKLSSNDKQLVKKLRYQRRKLKIIIMGLPTLLCLIQNYINLCLRFSQSIPECVKAFDTEKIGMGILTSFYMTLLLYIGPVYQEFWNGNLRKKLGKIKFNKFRWDYFTKIVITPLIDELIFRELVNNAINVKYENNVVFILYSTFLYCGSKSISYRIKYNHFSIFEFMKSIVLGLYLSFVLVQTNTIVTVIINHGLMNFMGRPNFKDLFKGDYSSEQQWSNIISNHRDDTFLCVGIHGLSNILYFSFVILLMDQYKILKRLGDGTYGCVYKATNISTGQIVAIKKFKKKYTSWEECVNLREVKALQKLKHPNIIKLVEVFKEKDELNLVFEYLDKDIYQQYLENKNNGKPLPEDKIRSFIKQVTEGLAYMHKVGYFHRDLKPENLLVTGDTVKICDFGLAREVRSKPPYTDYVATRWYRAPEILLKQQNYNSPVDIFALGCIMAELYTLNPLFNGASEIDQLFKLCAVLGTPTNRDWPDVQRLATAANITFPNCQSVPLEKIVPNASPEAIDLMRDMLKYDPQKRPSAKQILDYPYFSSYSSFPMIQPVENKVEFPKLERVEKHEKHDRHEEAFELPKINNKENRNKMNDSNSNFMDLLEQKLAEYDRPTRKENSFHKNNVKDSKEFRDYNQPKETKKEYEYNDSMDFRIDSRNKKGQGGLKFLKHNDPLGDQYRNNQQQQQQISMQQSKSYEPTKRNIYDFNMMQIPKPSFQPKLEMPKQNKNQFPSQNYPKSLPIAPIMGYKYQQQYQYDDMGFKKPLLKQYY